MREGEAGDRFVIIETGRCRGSPGAAGASGSRGPVPGIGEIALLADIPRTASARALEAIHGHTLDRGAFLEAVTGHASSQALAMSLVRNRLAADTTS